MTTVAEPIEKIPALGEDEVCHIHDGDGPEGPKAVCGAPFDCTGSDGKDGFVPWDGSTTCNSCRRTLCPECMALCRL